MGNKTNFSSLHPPGFESTVHKGLPVFTQSQRGLFGHPARLPYLTRATSIRARQSYLRSVMLLSVVTVRPCARDGRTLFLKWDMCHTAVSRHDGLALCIWSHLFASIRASLCRSRTAKGLKHGSEVFSFHYVLEFLRHEDLLLCVTTDNSCTFVVHMQE